MISRASVDQLRRPTYILNVDDSGGVGVPIFFQHGLCGDSSQAAAIFPLRDRWKRVTMECQGHGNTSLQDTDKISINHFTDDLIALLKNYDMGTAIIGGISMGASIALTAAIKQPTIIRGLVLVRPAWIAEACPANLAISRLAGKLLSQDSLDSAAVTTSFLKNQLVQDMAKISPDNYSTFLSLLSRTDRKTTSLLLSRISRDGPLISRQQIRHVSCPTLIIGTDRDPIHPLAIAEELHHLITYARLKIVTSKSDSHSRYLRDSALEIQNFLEEIF